MRPCMNSYATHRVTLEPNVMILQILFRDLLILLPLLQCTEKLWFYIFSKSLLKILYLLENNECVENLIKDLSDISFVYLLVGGVIYLGHLLTDNYLGKPCPSSFVKTFSHASHYSYQCTHQKD